MVARGNEHTVGNVGEEEPFVIVEVTLESGNVKENENDVIPSVTELSPKGSPELVRKEWKSTSEKEHHIIETEKKEYDVGSGGDDNHSVVQKVIIELPGNEWKLTIEKEHPVIQEEHEQVEERGDDGQRLWPQCGRAGPNRASRIIYRR